MKRNSSYRNRTSLVLRSAATLVFLVSSTILNAQKLHDFSGTWTQDNEKSDDYYNTFDVTVVINHSDETIIFKETFYDKTGKELATRESAFTLDGKESSVEEQGGINKESATWSTDKQTLTTKSTRTEETDVYGSTSDYSNSDDGNVLTIQTSDINPFGLSIKQIFNKKQQTG